MHFRSYNKEIMTAQGEIIRLFSNIVTVDKKGKRHLIPCMFGQTSRVLKSIFNPSAAPQMYPIITIERQSIRIDQNRNIESNNDIAQMASLIHYDPDTKPPTPIDITFKVTVFSKYPEELDMIICNFIPFYNKDVFVTTPHPKLEGKFLSHQIIWDGQIESSWKAEIANTEQDIQTATATFTYKTEIFGGTDKLNDEPYGRIYNINLSLSPSDGSIYPEFDPNNPDGNIIGGFYNVPYSESFDQYFQNLITHYNNGDADADAIYSVYNAMFNSAVLNDDIEGLKEAYAKGANIYKHSYWPYKYASTKKYTDIVDWLVENDALIPSSDKEHYPVDNNIKIADLNTKDEKTVETVEKNQIELQERIPNNAEKTLNQMHSTEIH